MKVLLVSPKDPPRPGNLSLLMGGENTYTQSLLSHPPRRVRYDHYADALEVGTVEDRQALQSYRWLMKARIMPPDAGILTIRVKNHFDLIHSHVYSLQLFDYRGPVVLSDSSSNYQFLRDYLGWGDGRIGFGYRLRRWYNRRHNIYDPSLNLARVKKLIVWSEFARKEHLKLGADPAKITVIPPGIAPLAVKKNPHRGFNILFIGVWFKRKGGDLVLEAFRLLRKKHTHLTLTIVGQLPPKTKLINGIRYYPYLPRERLIKEVYPKADVLVLVPERGEGYGLVVSEAASLGIPAIVSRVNALPELVDDRKTGDVIAPGNTTELMAKLEKMIQKPSLVRKMGEQAKKNFWHKFSFHQTNQKLLKVYQEAVGK